MSRKTLSPFAFFGGKGRFANEIVDMLDYTHTSVYVEPFGGACRVLLNKPRHEKEIYNDLGTGLVTFFEALSHKTTADRVIRKLNDMEISREVFIEQQRYKNEVEMDINCYITEQTLALISEISKKDKDNRELIKKAKRALNRHEYPIIVLCLNELVNAMGDGKDKDSVLEYKNLFEQYWEFIRERYSNNYVHQYIYWNDNKKFDIHDEEDLDFQFKYLMAVSEDKTGLEGLKTKDTPLESSGEEFGSERKKLINDLLEKAGGIEKFIDIVEKIELNDDAYRIQFDTKLKRKRKVSLHDIIHQIVLNELPWNGRGTNEYDDAALAVATFYTYALSMNGMGIVYSNHKGMDTAAYYRRVAHLDEIADRLNGVSFIQSDAVYHINIWRTQEQVMMYLDPSYLNDDKENVGKSYAESSSYKDHERLLELLLKKDTCAKIILSNYDVEPYKSRLTEENGWKKYEIETYTTVGGKKDNKRTEVLWRNY